MSFTIVNSTVGEHPGVGVSVSTAAVSHTAGNLLVMCVCNLDGGATATVASVTNTAGDTWIQAPGAYIFNGGFTYLDIWYCLKTNGNAADVTTVIWTNPTGSLLAIQVAQISASTGTFAFDVAATGVNLSSTNVTTSPFTPTLGSVLIAFGTQTVAAITTNWSAGIGYTLLANSGTGVNSQTEFLNGAAAISQVADINYTPASIMTITVASFKSVPPKFIPQVGAFAVGF